MFGWPKKPVGITNSRVRNNTNYSKQNGDLCGTFVVSELAFPLVVRSPAIIPHRSGTIIV
jgi:hypothetical protein